MFGAHGQAVAALLYLPVVLVAVAIAVDRGAAAGWRLAVLQVAGYGRATGGRRALVLLLAITAAIHLGLVPGHLDEDRGLAALFALDFAALAAAAGSGFDPRVPFWRPTVAVLLAANLAAYAGYLAAGVEPVDAIGVVAKTVEIAALILVIHPASAFVGIVERGSRRLEIN